MSSDSLTIKQETVYETWTLSLKEITENQNDFFSCNIMTKLPPVLLFPGHEIKIKAKFQWSQSNNSMNDGGGSHV